MNRVFKKNSLFFIKVQTIAKILKKSVLEGSKDSSAMLVSSQNVVRTREQSSNEDFLRKT